MKIRNLLITVAILIIGGFTIYFLGKSKADSGIKLEPKEVVKVWTAMDSLIYNFEQEVSGEIDNSHTVGAALALVYKGEVRILRCFGEKVNGSGDPVDRNTIFRLASVSKPITGTLAGILDDEEILPLNSRIIDYLPNFRLKDSINTYDLNVENILSHTSGLVPHAYDNLVEAGVDFREIMDSLFRVNISAPPGQLYGYQNVAFSLYDTLLEAKTRTSFEKAMKKNVFQPFGMRDASVGMKAFMDNKNKALPHTSSGTQYRTSNTNEGYFITQPAAGINASISDMSRFMLAMLGHNPAAIDSSTIKKILEPRVISPLRWNYLRKWNEVESKHYALGWRIIGAYGSEIAYHGGYIRGYRAELAVCPEEDFGIAYLSNSPNGSDSGIIPFFLNMYFKIN
ncbi:MAG: serine hydrolase domain-containing protein [Bacteroidales bacterium]